MSIGRVALFFDDTRRPDTTGVYCLRALAQLVEAHHFRPGQLGEVQAGDFDLYLWIDDGLRHEVSRSLRPCAWWAIDTHLDFQWYRKRAGDFDFVLAAQRDGAGRLREEGIEAAWLPLACDPEIHRRHEVPKEFDICFVGNVFPGPREDLLALVRQHYPNTLVGQRYFDQMARAYSASRIVFNRSIRNDVNMRVFEALACGSLLLTNELSDNGQEEMFRDGVHLATYRGPEELLEKIAFYLEKEGLREQIASAGREEAIAKHTYRHRMETLLSHVGGRLSRTVPVRAGFPAQRPPKDPAYYEFSGPELLAMVPLSARRVLDVGCAAGRFGQTLKVRQPAHVTGVEVDAGAAELARSWLDRVVVADVEEPGTEFPDKGFDCIVCADVLEHLRQPDKVLEKLRRWLSPQGALVASLPNVRHYSVVSALLDGNWTYEPAGLLDEGHLHFFTRRDAVALFESSGFEVRQVRNVPGPGHPQWCQDGRPDALTLGRLIIRGLAPGEAEEFFVYQYLIDAGPVPLPAHVGVSIVILTYNGLEYTRQCVESILQRTAGPYELVFVDNGSTDGTAEYLRSLPDARLIENPENRGFPAAVNQGIRASHGDYVVLVNNDVIVTRGWLRRLVEAADRDDRIGLVGPCLTWPECPQSIEVPYRSLEELEGFAAAWAEKNAGRLEPVPELVGACLLIRRRLIDETGVLDEDFGIGQCEDKDYCRRAAAAGYRCVIAREAFVHHFGHRTFLAHRIDSAGLLARNKQLLRRKAARHNRASGDTPMKEFTFPETVEGWLTPVEGNALAELARARRVLEIGAWQGRSTICLAQTAEVVHSVDHHRGDCHTGHKDTLPPFLANLKRHGVDEKVVVHRGDWRQVVPFLAPRAFDLIFVDDDHEAEGVEAVIQAAAPRLAPHGAWAFHDYANREFLGVKEAVDRFVAKAGVEVRVVDSIAVVRTAVGPSLSVVVPTVGRATLERTLASIAQQKLLPEDEILVIADGEHPPAQSMFHASGLPGLFLSLPGPAGDWGHTPRNEAMRRARGDYLLYIDDDDFYTPGAFESIRRALGENPGRPHMFKMQRLSRGEVLWKSPQVCRGNVSTQMFVHPNQPQRTGRWSSRYEGDYDFIRSTLEKWPGGALVWREEVVTVWGRQ